MKKLKFQRGKKGAPRKLGAIRLVIAVIVWENMDGDTETCLFQLQQHPTHIGRVKVMGTIVHHARNKAFRDIDKYFGDIYTHVLFVDSDMVFSVKDYEKLLEVDKPIVGGLAVRKGSPHAPTYVPLSKNPYQHLPLMRELQKEEPEPLQVLTVGMGFTLIKREVIEATKQTFEEGGLDEWFYYDRDLRDTEMGEDYSFSMNAVRAGYDVWLHPGVQVGHMARFPVYFGDFVSFLNSQTEEAVGMQRKIELAGG